MMKMCPTCLALVPARSGSKRIKDKNIRPLAGHPLIAYTISAALESGVFDSVVVSTDSEEYAEIARSYGAEVPFLVGQDGSCHTDTSPDIAWVRQMLEGLMSRQRRWECFSILRPTSPFRTAATIRRAWQRWLEKGANYDSLRAVEPVKQHPFKTWKYDPISSSLQPFMADVRDWWQQGAPGHSRQYASLPPIYVQNASLEIAWTKTVSEQHSISGERVLPFFTEGYEGFDINRSEDWDLAELLIARGDAKLPEVSRA